MTVLVGPGPAGWLGLLLLLFFVSAARGQDDSSVQRQAGDERQSNASRENPGPEQIRSWINQLGDRSFFVREHAYQELKKAGPAAYPDLYRNRKTPDLERRLLIADLLKEIGVNWVREADSPAVSNLMLEFSQRKPLDRLAIVDRLSWLPADECWSSLYRIVVYDSTPFVRNHAAARLLEICLLRDRPLFPAIEARYARQSAPRYLSLDWLLKTSDNWSEKIVAVLFSLNRSQGSILDPEQSIEKGIVLQRDFFSQALKAQQWSDLEAHQLANQVLLDTCIRSGNLKLDSVNRMMIETGHQLIALGFGQGEKDNIEVREFAEQYINESLQILLDAGQYQAAKKLASPLPLDRLGPVASLLTAEAASRTGAGDLAERILQKVSGRLEQRTDDIDLLLEELADRGLQSWAIRLLDRVEQIKGSLSLPNRVRLAEFLLQQGELERALATAETIMRQSQDPDLRQRAATVLANIYQAKKDVPREAEAWKLVLRENPQSVPALLRLLELAAAEQNLDRQDILQRIDIAKGAFRDRYRLGKQMASSTKPAEANLGRNQMATAANHLASLLAGLGEELQMAREKAAEAVALEPMNPAFLATMARVEFKLGNRDRARIWLARASFAAPHDRAILERLKKYDAEN